MAKLSNLEPIIFEILEKYEEARNSDMNLYHIYCTKYGVLNEYKFGEIFINENYRKSLGLYTFGSVERCRRKLQERYPHLKCDKETDNARYDQFKETLNYIGR